MPPQDSDLQPNAPPVTPPADLKPRRAPRAPKPGGRSFLERNWRPLLAAAFGITFVFLMLVIAFFDRNPTPFSLFVYRVVLSLAAAGIGAVLPGLLKVKFPFAEAAGALALFLLVFLVNPPSLIAPQPVVENAVSVDVVADLILGMAPSLQKDSQKRLLEATIDALSVAVPIQTASDTALPNCAYHRTVFLQLKDTLVKLQTFGVPAGRMRVRGLSDGQQEAKLVTGRSFLAVRETGAFRQLHGSVKYKGLAVYEFSASANSELFIASYYPSLAAFTQNADEIGVEVTDICDKVAETLVAFAGAPFETISFEHSFEISRLVAQTLVELPSDRIRPGGSLQDSTQRDFGDFVSFIRQSPSEAATAVGNVWDGLTGPTSSDAVWEGNRYKEVESDLLIVAYGKSKST